MGKKVGSKDRSKEQDDADDFVFVNSRDSMVGKVKPHIGEELT